jgi:hypothetical protein
MHVQAFNNSHPQHTFNTHLLKRCVARAVGSWLATTRLLYDRVLPRLLQRPLGAKDDSGPYFW